MPVELSQLSFIEYGNIASGKMTPAVAADYLKNGRLVTRSFTETLKEMYPAPDLSSRLLDFFLSLTPEANTQSVSRKIRNWLTDRNHPADREDIFRIAFALELTERQLNDLLSLCTGFCVQYRNNLEVILVWFLRNGYSYSEARQFFASLPPITERNVAHSKHTSHLTHEMQMEFQSVRNMEQLQGCYIRNLENFGSMHLRAYYYFEKFLTPLIRPTSHLGHEAAEPDYALETVMETYLSFPVPSGKKRTDFTLVQKLLKQNWPNATSLKNIRNHKEDVSRKLLLLLYVATENEISDSESYTELDEDYISLEDRVEYHWWTINAMLEDCGMAALDPRNVMDWLILYAISSDPEEPMRERLEQVLSCVFDPDSRKQRDNLS